MRISVHRQKRCGIYQKKMFPVKDGDAVKEPIFDVARVKTNSRNLLCVVMSVDRSKYYTLATKSGILKQNYTRNQFFVCKKSFISLNDVPNNEKSLRELVYVGSLTSGQGFKRCYCKGKCASKKWNCKASNILCISKCHGSDPCSNN